MVRAKPTRIEDFGSIPRGVWWKVEEVGDGSNDCSDLVGTGEARGKDVVVTRARIAGFREHLNENPVADGKLRVATMAVRLAMPFSAAEVRAVRAVSQSSSMRWMNVSRDSWRVFSTISECSMSG